MQFSIGKLFVLLTLACLLTASCVAIEKFRNYRLGYGPYERFDDWPVPLKLLIERDPSTKSEVTPFGISTGFDRCSVWKMKTDSKLRRLMDEFELDQATKTHPKVAELLQSIPKDWPQLNYGACNWFATPGYGSVHIECVDLFLIADDPNSGQTYVLHENIF